MYRPRTGKIAYGVIGDCCLLGEASVRLHLDLGSDPIIVKPDGARRAKRGIADRIVFAPLPGTRTTPQLDLGAWRAQIARQGTSALNALGGIGAVAGCRVRAR